jgi:hypothetical protein
MSDEGKFAETRERMIRIARIRSGAQTGVDRGALDAARALGIPLCGWVPRGGLAEDFPLPPGVLAPYPELTETPSPDYEQRTLWNIRDSDATLIIFPLEGELTRGTKLTFENALETGKPVLIVDGSSLEPIIAWLKTLAPATGDGLELNVAGPRERFAPGAYRTAYRLIGELLQLSI